MDRQQERLWEALTGLLKKQYRRRWIVLVYERRYANAVYNNVDIRPIGLNDAFFLRQCADDEMVARTTGIPHPYPDNAAEEWIKLALKREAEGVERTFAIIYLGDFVGVVQLREISAPPCRAFLEYFVASHAWNRGVATAASFQALCIAFNEVGCDVVQASSLERNIPSVRVLQKLGFAQCGCHTSPVNENDKFSGETWIEWRLDRRDWQQGSCHTETQ